MIVKYNCYMKKEDMFSRFEMKMPLFFLIFSLLSDDLKSSANPVMRYKEMKKKN